MPPSEPPTAFAEPSTAIASGPSTSAPGAGREFEVIEIEPLAEVLALGWVVGVALSRRSTPKGVSLFARLELRHPRGMRLRVRLGEGSLSKLIGALTLARVRLEQHAGASRSGRPAR